MSKTLLHKAVDAIVTLKHPGRMLEGNEVIEWLGSVNLRHATISISTGDATGFGPEGVVAVSALAKALRVPSTAYRRGSSHATFAEGLAKQLIVSFGKSPRPTVDDDAVVQFEADVAAWFVKEAVVRRHFVPCTILPERAGIFAVGPVTFIHADEIIGHPIGLAADNAFTDIAWDNLRRALNERAAGWVAVVDIDGCHPVRASEVADLAVDVAITAVQLIVPAAYSKHMARVTARTAPAWRGNLTVTSGQICPGVQNNLPALGLSAADFDALITAGEKLLAAAGRRLSMFVTGQVSLPKIDQAWCDAAYWFHEGLAEPLDTVATVKLETAVEVLLRSESSKGSAKRMRQAIEAVTGLTPKAPIAPGSSMTVEQFAKTLVGARSQVLHGTFSTLTEELAPERSSLMGFSHLLLATFALQIDAYAASNLPSDDIEALLRWIDVQRAPVSPTSTRRE